ncbi:MAG: hypothetical protein CV089_08755 [Nitrospira sp. WS110]|nr:hypothetical protein [Nitrospira sp. WS110]
MNPWLTEDMEGVFNSMKATGRSQFTLEEIQAFVRAASEEAGDAQYREFLKEHPEIAEKLKAEEAEFKEQAQQLADENTIDRIERSLHEAESQPISWAQAAEGLDIPQRQASHETEMER